MSDGLHVGMIGIGRIGRFHLETLRSLERVRHVTVADLDRSLAARIAAEQGVGLADSPEALVEQGLDAIAIATPTAAHSRLIRLAASAGIPVFCEKPVATELDSIDAVLDETGARDAFVQIGFQRRFDAGYLAARSAVENGALGTLLVVRGATHDPSPPPESYIAGSGGIFRDLHIHDFDAIRFVTGQEVTEIFADGAVRETRWFADHDDVDAAVATMRLSGGALAILSGARHDALGYDVRLELFGTGDSIAVGVDGRTPLHSVEAGVPRPTAVPYANFLERFAAAYRAELAAFVECVLTGTASPCTLADARAALVVALAADRSRLERRAVPISELGSAPAGTMREGQ
jgi:myo-inositol 2-dehydrogenase/D-chiro-inositol 1-dehydrogenase